VGTHLDAAFWLESDVAVTGGAGFIGSTLAMKLATLGAKVTVIDSLIPEYGGNLVNLRGYEDRLKINLSDIRDPYSLKALLRGKTHIFNLAGQTSHMDSMHKPSVDLEINCQAQLSMLEICKEVSPECKIVFASTRQLYGRPKYLPVDESHPIAPVDINGIHKLAAEMYHQLYSEIYDLSCVVLRLTNTIGPRMRIADARQTFLGVWIKNLLIGKPIQVWGGQQLRDFNDVDDVVDALLRAGCAKHTLKGPYNLGSHEKISLLELAQKMVGFYGSGSIEIMEYPEERKKIDIGDYYSCFDKFKMATAWHPQITLDQTLQRTLEYFISCGELYL